MFIAKSCGHGQAQVQNTKIKSKWIPKPNSEFRIRIKVDNILRQNSKESDPLG